MNLTELINLWGKDFVDECIYESKKRFGIVPNINMILVIAVSLILKNQRAKGGE